MKTEVIIERVLNSSTVRGIGYLPDTQELFIEFSNGVIYKYNNVPENLYIDLLKLQVLGNMGTKSPVGKFINNHVKGAFDYEKVDQPSEDYEFITSVYYK